LLAGGAQPCEKNLFNSRVWKACQRFDTRSQLRRAALSVMNNIAEGFGKYSNKEFIRYLDTACNSASEVKSILYLLLDLHYLEVDKIIALQSKVDEVRALTLALIRYLIKRETQTHKHPNT